MAYRARKRVRRVGAWIPGELEQAPHHVLDLALRRMAVADDRLLHLERGVFGYRKRVHDRRADRGATCLPEQQRRLRILVDEDFLERDLVGPGAGNDLAQSVEYGLQPQRQVAGGRPDAAAGDVSQRVARPVEHAEAGDTQARIDAEDAHARGSRIED